MKCIWYHLVSPTGSKREPSHQYRTNKSYRNRGHFPIKALKYGPSCARRLHLFPFQLWLKNLVPNFAQLWDMEVCLRSLLYGHRRPSLNPNEPVRICYSPIGACSMCTRPTVLKSHCCMTKLSIYWMRFVFSQYYVFFLLPNVYIQYIYIYYIYTYYIIYIYLDIILLIFSNLPINTETSLPWPQWRYSIAKLPPCGRPRRANARRSISPSTMWSHASRLPQWRDVTHRSLQWMQPTLKVKTCQMKCIVAKTC